MIIIRLVLQEGNEPAAAQVRIRSQNTAAASRAARPATRPGATAGEVGQAANPQQDDEDIAYDTAELAARRGADLSAVNRLPKAPAAAVVRLGKSNAQSGGSVSQPATIDSSMVAAEQPETDNEEPEMIGEIVERQPETPMPPSMPTLPSHGGFPAARHRSVHAFGRKPGGAVSVSAPAATQVGTLPILLHRAAAACGLTNAHLCFCLVCRPSLDQLPMVRSKASSMLRTGAPFGRQPRLAPRVSQRILR